jgi:hypothetical protein
MVCYQFRFTIIGAFDAYAGTVCTVGSRRSLDALYSGGPGISLRALRTGRTRITFLSLWAGWSSGPGFTLLPLRTDGTLWSLRSLASCFSLCTLLASRSRIAFLSLRASWPCGSDRASFALMTCRASNSLWTGRTRVPLFAFGTRYSLRALDSLRTTDVTYVFPSFSCGIPNIEVTTNQVCVARVAGRMVCY